MKKTKLIRNVLAVLAVLATVVFISCGALFGDGQSGNITINLPPISSAARAISSDKISDLKNVTTSYRVTVNGMTREGAGGTFTFTLPVGMVAEITVECLNSGGNVIVRAKKTHTVTAGENNVNINLSQDGDVVGTGGSNPPSGGNTSPAPPAPVQWQVTYNGNGAGSGTPSDTQTYDVGNEVTLQTGEPARAGYEFAGWTSNVELEATGDVGGTVQITQGTAFVSASSTAQGVTTKITSFKMPEGGVVLTAKWTPITYTIKFDAGGGMYTQDDLQFTVEDTGKSLPASNKVTVAPEKGKVFSHWATSAGGASVTLVDIIDQIKNGASGLTMSGNDITIYAVWENDTPLGNDEFYFEFDVKGSSVRDGKLYTGESMIKSNIIGRGHPESGIIRVREGDNIEETIKTWHAQYAFDFKLISVDCVIDFDISKYINDPNVDDPTLVSLYDQPSGNTFSKTEMDGKKWTVSVNIEAV